MTAELDGGESRPAWPMDDLQRHLAPISTRAWAMIEQTARETLTVNLAARKIVDFRGPLGWTAGAVDLGTVDTLPTPPAEGVGATIRRVQPLVELRVGFVVARAELDAIDRGGRGPDLTPLVEAATRIARAEDRAVFHGYAAGRIDGLQPRIRSLKPEAPPGYPALIAEALRVLRTAGVGGPYALAAGARCFTELHATTERNGFLVLDAVREILGGSIVWAPAIDGAVVVSMRGGDFELTIGRDIAIGYLGHTASAVELFLVEDFTFQVLTPEAAVWLQV
jgi:uncharacterized linocin/CFP29 family protein